MKPRRLHRATTSSSDSSGARSVSPGCSAVPVIVWRRLTAAGDAARAEPWGEGRAAEPVRMQGRLTVGERDGGPSMHNLVMAPIPAGSHLAIWLIWQSTGVTLLEPQSRQARIHERQEARD